MLDHLATHLALRNRALAAVIATTGSTSLSATATGYNRVAGSFIADGFVTGLEFTASGFANNGARIVQSVTASDLTTTTAQAVETAAAGRMLLAGAPVLRAFENIAFTPTSGRPYLEEDYVPGTNSLLSVPAQGGILEETGLYVIKIYGLSGTGISAIRKYTDAIKALFAPGTKLVAGSNTVRVRADTSVQSGQILPQDGGWSVCVITIPWRAESINLVAA